MQKCIHCGFKRESQLDDLKQCELNPLYNGRDPLEIVGHEWHEFYTPHGLAQTFDRVAYPSHGPIHHVTTLWGGECNTGGVVGDNYLDPRNPKDIVGQLKPPMHAIPPSALIEEAKVMGNGVFKYGLFNWRDKNVSHTTYIAAALRHILAHLDGQDFDPGAKELARPAKGGDPQPQPYQVVRNLAAARASLGILIDAILTGHAIDDRPKDGVAGEMLYPEDKKDGEA